jgi:hypothetical protein
MYIEVHPCAKFFDAERSLWYKTDGVPYSYEKCKGMKHAAAWRSTEQRSGGVECMPMGGDLPVGLKPDQRHCFTFQQPKDGPKYGTLISPD